MTPQPRLNHPVFVLIRGLPGSGKSYLTKPLATAIQQIIGEPVITLDPDATDYDSPAYREHVAQATAEGVDPALHAYRFLRAQAYDGITEHKVVIWNQPFTNLDIFNKMVARFHEQAELDKTTVALLVVEVQIDPATAKQRVMERKNQGGHGPSDATFERFVHDYTSFASEGYDTVTVDGQDEATTSVATIMVKLQGMLQQALGN